MPSHPGSRYFVTEHSIEPAAAMTKTVFSPGLQGGPSEAGATGRTNVFMNGLQGPGPMGFQPSVFDFDAGDAHWSPYWDHYTYAWTDEAEARLLTTEGEIHAARDGGGLDEFPGMPETKGTVFTAGENRAGSTELRWDLPGALAPGAEGYVSFRAMVR